MLIFIGYILLVDQRRVPCPSRSGRQPEQCDLGSEQVSRNVAVGYFIMLTDNLKMWRSYAELNTEKQTINNVQQRLVSLFWFDAIERGCTEEAQCQRYTPFHLPSYESYASRTSRRQIQVTTLGRSRNDIKDNGTRLETLYQ